MISKSPFMSHILVFNVAFVTYDFSDQATNWETVLHLQTWELIGRHLPLRLI